MLIDFSLRPLYLTNDIICHSLYVIILEASMELVIALTGAFAGIAGLITSKDRLAFLSNVIFDTSIPRESRQPFYDEYIAKRGYGTVVKFWLLEGQRDKVSKS